MNNVERFEILETWARGPMVINQRIDRFTRFQIKAWHGTGVFFLKMSLLNDRIEPVPEQPELKEGASSAGTTNSIGRR